MLVDFVLLGLGVASRTALSAEVAAEHDYNLDAGGDHERPPLDAVVDLRLLLVVLRRDDLDHLDQVSVAPELHDSQDDEEVDPDESHTHAVESTHRSERRHYLYYI